MHRWITDKASYVGVQVKNLVYRIFNDNPEIEEHILESFGHRSNDDLLNADWLNKLRSEVADLLVRNRTQQMPNECEIEGVDNELYKTSIRGKLFITGPWQFRTLVRNAPVGHLRVRQQG